jgi:chemotaxis protein CheY-P-specific phosphatase CheC
MLPDQVLNVTDDELADIARAGAEHARVSLESLLGDSISIVESRAWPSVDNDSCDLFAHLDEGDATRVGRLGITGPPDGAAWVVVPDSCVQRLITRYGGDADDDGSMSHSIAAEVANIVTGAYVIELGNRWGVDLEPTPADLSPFTGAARSRLNDALNAHQHALAVGCGFSDSEGSYGLSVVVMVDDPKGGHV